MAYFLFNYTAANAQKGVPLRKQAAALLELGLWGIGDKTQNRKALQPGDQVVAYVGAPERAFVGRATLSSGTHPWTPDEKQRYPLTFGQGVALDDATVWEKPVPLALVWSDLTAAKTNPKAIFQGGVSRLVQEDYEAIVAAAGSSPPKPKPIKLPSGDTTTPPGANGGASSALFDAAERLKKFLAGPATSLSEDATRAHFINRYLEALGYTEFEDIDYGAPVDSGDFADYVLRVDGDAVACVEAKKLGAPLGAKEAAQVVKYSSVLGVRWGILTDGRYIKVYDPRVPGVPPEERLVFEVDLSDYTDREAFEAQVAPDLLLLTKAEIASDAGLDRRAAALAVRELLTKNNSKTLQALREELKTRKLIQLSTAELADLMGDVLT